MADAVEDGLQLATDVEDARPKGGADRQPGSTLEIDAARIDSGGGLDLDRAFIDRHRDVRKHPHDGPGSRRVVAIEAAREHVSFACGRERRDDRKRNRAMHRA